MFRRHLSTNAGHISQRFITLLVWVMLLTVTLSSQVSLVRAATLTVTTENDHDDGTCDADCTLREAIIDANGLPGADVIEFNITGGSPQTIVLDNALGPLDTITGAGGVSIDGSTQSIGAACNAPPIILDGNLITGAANGLDIVAGNSTIRGLTITRFQGHGINISSGGNNTIQCNVIGDAAGNGGDGINITGSSNNVIGGTGNGNEIAINTGNGVNVVSGTGNAIRANSIFSNGGLGISLGAGANNDQTAPVLTLAQSDGVSSTTIVGTLTSTPSSNFTVEFFQCDTTSDEGQTLIGLIPMLTTDGTGNAAINVTLPTGVSLTDSISATATSAANNTSPFSACLGVTGLPVYDSTPADGATINITTAVGTPLGATITVFNPGNADLNVTGITLSNTTDFTPPATTTFTVNAGDTTVGQSFIVECNATTTVGSPFTTTVTVSHNAGADATYTINCTVDPTATPDFESAPNPGQDINFGNVTVGTTSTANLTITSNGSAPLDVSAPPGPAPVLLSGPNPGDFNIPPGELPITALTTFEPLAIECTPTAVGARQATLTLVTNDPDAAEATVNYTLLCDGVAPVITLSPATLPNTFIGDTTYSEIISASGGTAPYTFAVTTAILPPGMSLDPATGVLDGTPTTANSYTFTVTATDSNGFPGSEIYTIVVNPGITVTPPTLPDGVVGTAYSEFISATGGSGTYTNFAIPPGDEPPGLSLNPTTGELSGTPTTTVGSPFTFTVTVTDSLGATGSQPYTINITATAITIAPATVPDGTVGTAYVTQTIIASGGVAPITLTHSGNVPPGLTFVDATGVLSGTPTTTVGSPFTFTVTATDSVGTTEFIDYTIAISPAPPLTFTPATVPDGTVGTAYVTQTIIASGGVAPITLTHTGNVPPGLTFVDATGVLSGTPTTTVGSPFTFTVTATDSVGATEFIDYTIAISPPLALTILPASVPNGTVGTPYITQNFTTNGGIPPVTLTHSGNVPPGLTFVDATGVLSGTPTTAGTFVFDVTATDSVPTSVTQTYTVVISNAPTITVNPPTLPNGALTVPYNQTITAMGGTGSITFGISAGALPGGLTLSPAGLLSGTPTATGPFTFTIQATDSLLATGIRAYTVVIAAAPVPIYTSSPTAPGNTIDVGTVLIGTAISTNLSVTNAGTATLIVQAGGTGLITGANFADFAVFTTLTPSIPFSVVPSATQAVTIRCIPSAAGLRVATLSFITNDPNRTTVTYALQCTGSGTLVPTATPIGFVPTATAFVPTPTPVLPATGTVDGVKGLALRTGPYLGATLLGKAIPGAPYPILAQSNDEGGGITWYLITVDEVTGWVSGLYLKISGNVAAVPFQGSIFDQIDGAPDLGVTARAMSIIDIRRRPSGRAAILTQVPQHGVVRLLGRTRQNNGDFWVQINYNGVIGWIPAAPIAVNGHTGNVPIR